MRFFADTSYWIALINPDDHLHRAAVGATKSIPRATIVTSELVLVELLNGFSRKGGSFRKRAAEYVEYLRTDRHISIQAQTSAQFAQALLRYKMASDKGWSLTDCSSFHIMEAEGIREALTHDRHFEQAGFKALLR